MARKAAHLFALSRPRHNTEPVATTSGAIVEIHQVRYFLAVTETLNFTKAAERCNVSQPALTGGSDGRPLDELNKDSRLRVQAGVRCRWLRGHAATFTEPTSSPFHGGTSGRMSLGTQIISKS